MKKLVGLLIILVVIVLGGYYGMGVVTERTLKKDVGMINQSNGLYVDIKRYDRGWFTSKAELIWKIRIPERIAKNQNGQSAVVPAQDYSVEMPLHIYHGPIIFSKDGVKFGLGYAKTEIKLPQQLEKPFAENFSKESTAPQLDLSILVNYLNNSRLRIQLPEFTLIAKEGNGQFKWFGLTSDVTMTSKLNDIDGDITIDGLEVSKDKMVAVISKVSSDYSLYEDKNGLYLGHANFSLPSIVVTNDNKKIFELEKLNFNTKSDVDADLFSSYLEASLKHLYSNHESYGPGELKVSIRNLDADTLARINEQANKLQGANDQMRQQFLFAIMPELPKLFSKGAEFEISKLHMVMPEGSVDGHLSINLPKGEQSNPFQLIQQIQGEGELQLPERLVKNLLKESVKHELLKQPNLQEALTNQMQKDNASEADQAQPADNEQEQDQSADQDEANQASNETPQDSKPITKQTTLAELDQRAQVKAEEKLKALVNAGALQKKGTQYVIQVTLRDGQLMINGNPFNSTMIQF